MEVLEEKFALKFGTRGHNNSIRKGSHLSSRIVSSTSNIVGNSNITVGGVGGSNLGRSKSKGKKTLG